MPQIQLLDGKKIDFEKSITGFDLTKKISKSLEKTALIIPRFLETNYMTLFAKSQPPFLEHFGIKCAILITDTFSYKKVKSYNQQTTVCNNSLYKPTACKFIQ